MGLNRPEYWVHGQPTPVNIKLNSRTVALSRVVPNSVTQSTYAQSQAGFTAQPGPQDHNYPFYLSQGSWIQQGPALNDGHYIYDWTGLIAPGGLYQAGTIMVDPPSGGGSATYYFFYEIYVNQYGEFPEKAPSPQLHVGDDVAAVVDLTLGQITYFEVCDYTGTSSCAWYPDGYSNPTGYALQARWMVEDATGSPYSNKYQEVYFGPYSGNQNIVDDTSDPNSWQFESLDNLAFFMGPNTQTNYLGPGPLRVDTYFDVCPSYPGVWYQGGPNPTC